MRLLASLALVVLSGAFSIALTACAGDNGRLLSELHLSAQSVSASGNGTPITVDYSLSRPATVTAYLSTGSGQKLFLRRDENRPVAGNYQISFNGAFAPDPATDERRIVPAGTYELVVEAKDGRSSERSEAKVQVRDSDTTMPTIKNLTLYPDTLTPNGDGIDDSMKITYHTDKLANVTLYLVSESGKRYVLERQDQYEAGEHSTTWDGQIINQLLPSGSYQFVVEAQDAAGNVAVAQKPLKIDAASMPDAHILSVNFEPTKVLFGDLVKVTIRVKNTGNTVLRTQGPDPGYVYDSQEGFSTIEGGKYRDQKGLWRVGVDWAGGPGASGARYPYRWGFGKDLGPGEEATVVGYIRIDHKYPRIWLYAGLVQEQVRYWDNEVGQTVVEIGY